VLAQFPFGFFPNRDNLGYLERFMEWMGDVPLVFEFRNQTWLKEDTFQFLERNRVGYCIVDEPKLPKLMPYLPRATSEIGYFRFHGRNPNWFNTPVSVRYNYLTARGVEGIHSRRREDFQDDWQNAGLFQQLSCRPCREERGPDGETAGGEILTKGPRGPGSKGSGFQGEGRSNP